MVHKDNNLAIVYDDLQLAIGALASKDCIAIASKIDSARLNGFRVMRTEYWIDWAGKITGEGPIIFGFTVHHSAGEVELTIEADPQSSAELEGNAVAKRPVWPLEIAGIVATEGPPEGQKGVFNPKWSNIEGRGAFWWAYNLDDAALQTGMVCHFFAKHFGVWLRD